MRKILFLTYSRFAGGDDEVLMHLVSSWPDKDRLSVALNAAHPGRRHYADRIGARAELLLLDERSFTEPGEEAGGLRRAALQWSRPFRFAAGVVRLFRFFRTRRPDALFLSSGGYPPSDVLWRALWAARAARVPQVHLIVHNYPPPASGPLRDAYRGVVGRLTPRLCGRLVAVSEDLAGALGRFAPLRRPPVCIPNGLPEADSRLSSEDRRRLLGGAGGPVLGAMGHLEERKGFLYLIEAMPRILEKRPNTRLLLFGAATDPGYRAKLERRIDALDIEGSVRLSGYLPGASRFVDCFDVCLVPSVRHESFGMVALEAMRRGRPVVATRVGGLKEVVEHGRTGLLVPPKDPEALGRAVLELLGDPERARAYGEAGRERWRRRFTAERMAERYGLLAGGGKTR